MEHVRHLYSWGTKHNIEINTKTISEQILKLLNNNRNEILNNLSELKTIIGKNYPEPIVVHEKARAAALEAFQSLKKKLI